MFWYLEALFLLFIYVCHVEAMGNMHHYELQSKELEKLVSDEDILFRIIRSEPNDTKIENERDLHLFEDRMDDELKSNFGFPDRNHVPPDGGSKEQGTTDEGLMGSTSDYVLIAMIVAMMFCMTLCCLCLFCRSSSRLSICGINFELNDRRNSLDNGENLSEIHEVVPLTPTTAGDYNHRIQDIESMLRSDAPPPMYTEIVKRAEAQGHQAKAAEAKGNKSCRKKTHSDRPSETSSSRSNGGRSSWRISGRSIFASFRAKSSILRSRRSESAIQCPTVDEQVTIRCHHSDHALPPTLEEIESSSGTPQRRAENETEVTVETVNGVTRETDNRKEIPAERNKVFVYDVNELQSPEDDDDVFL
ncbi:uncharacterized protein LOC120337399 [Styela clava]